MAVAQNGGTRLHWREDGAGEPLLLLNSVGCDLTLWNAVMPYLKGFRVLRMNMRGHGESVSPPGDYTLDQIADDALAVMDAAGVDKAAICGLSLGGMTAMTLALKAPSRVSALVLACTSARIDRQIWDARIATVRSRGMAAIVDAVMTRFFSEDFLRDFWGWMLKDMRVAAPPFATWICWTGSRASRHRRASLPAARMPQPRLKAMAARSANAFPSQMSA